MIPQNRTVNILGIRGIPAAHGGFETFAGHLAPYLTEKGWHVNVYCQLDPNSDGSPQNDFEDDWNGIRRIHLATKSTGSRGSIEFDWRCVKDAAKRPGVDLVLGYNTAIFTILLRLHGKTVVMNMDGVEWRRDKWSLPVKLWFYLNEFFGSHIANVPVADHPEIAKHLRRHGRSVFNVIPYGSHALFEADAGPLANVGVTSNDYFISIARIEPENSILEIVRSFSGQRRSAKLLVLGRLDDENEFHRSVRAAASDQVVFAGAIYDPGIVAALRVHALAYVHGHQVGGTNPSLVEALGAGSAIIAHDNKFNRWVAGPDQVYFATENQLSLAFTQLEEGTVNAGHLRSAARQVHAQSFTLEKINQSYEALLSRVTSKVASK